MGPSLAKHAKGFLSWRQPGGMLSAAGHAVLLVASVYAFHSAKPFNPAEEAIAVDVVSDSQFSEMMKGEAKADKKPEPQRRVDRVAETREDKDPGEAKRDVPTPPMRAEIPPPLPPARPEPSPQIAAVTPPVRPPLRTAPPLPAPPEKIEDDAEVVKQAPPKKAEPKPEPPKPDALDDLLRKQQQEAERQKAAEEKRKLDEKLKAEAEAKKKAEEKRRAETAEKKAREEKARKEKEAREKAEEKKLADSILAKLQTSKEAPASTGATGAAVNRTASLGTRHAAGNKLSPSDRGQLIALLTEQMSRCISYNGSAPKAYPVLTFQLGRDGAITSAVRLGNSSPEANFMPFSEAAMRALRNCQPYRIPARFMDSYDDWKNIQLTLVTDDMR